MSYNIDRVKVKTCSLRLRTRLILNISMRAMRNTR